MMVSTGSLDTLTEDQLRTLARELIAEVTLKQTAIEKLAHENALLKRLKFGARTESYCKRPPSAVFRHAAKLFKVVPITLSSGDYFGKRR